MIVNCLISGYAVDPIERLQRSYDFDNVSF